MVKRKLTKPQLQIRRVEQYLGSAACHICGAVFFAVPHSTRELSEALNQLLERNDALRIVLDPNDVDGQIVRDYCHVDVPVLSFSKELDYRRYIEDYRKQAMDSRRNMFECAILHFPERDGILFKVHHLVSDAWSLTFLAWQVQELLEGKMPETGSYAEFAAREEQRLSGARCRTDFDFFQTQLEQYGDASARQRAGASAASDCMSLKINREEAERIRTYAVNAGVTLPVFFLTVLGHGLYRLYGRPKSFYVGVPVRNRTGVRELRTAGMFVNNAPVLLCPDEKRSFRENLTQIVGCSWFQTLRHQKCNYSELLERLGRPAEHMYDVLLSFHPESLPSGEIASFEQYSCGQQPEALQIHIEDRMQTGAFEVRYEYRKDSFTEEQIRRLHRFLCDLAATAMEEDGKPVFVLCREICRNTSVVDNMDCPVESMDSETVADLFDRQLRRQPEALCLLGRGWQVNRGEFRRDILKVDCYLRQTVKGRNRPIALLLERGPAMYAAIYGVLRAGHAFVPLDSANPPERIRDILKDCEAALLLTDGCVELSQLSVPVLRVDRLLAEESAGVSEAMPAASPEDIAYILYTSGSTGKPKGAAIRHDSLRNRIEWMQKCYPLNDRSVLLQKTPYTFDVSVWEILWWSLYGGTLAVSRPGEHFLPEAIAADIHLHQVTHIHFVPTVFAMFLSWLEQHPERCSDVASLERVFLSGEALSAELVNRFRSLVGPGPSVHNLYGPTECAIDVTYYDCQDYEQDPVPIGRPVDRTAVYVVDEQGEPVLPGMTGELWIGGIQVGDGYVNRSELSKALFIPNPFGRGRVYKTGDMVSLREDGQLIYHGRKDTQFKLNGQRMEAGEIEAVIRAHPSVLETLVFPEKQGEGDVLVACYCGDLLPAAELRRHCLEKLPAAMVPTIWYHVEEIPLNANGKADREALRLRERKICESRTESVPPENALERQICRSFSEILGRDINDRNADFVLCGGGSMDVIRLLSTENYAGVTAAEFLADPTPAGLAGRIQKAEHFRQGTVQCLYSGSASGRAVILFPYAGGTAAGFADLCRELRKNNPYTALFFVAYPHSEKECAAAAEKLAELAGQYRMTFYSHCVGAAPALRIAAELEQRGFGPEKLVVAALIPPRLGRMYFKHPWGLVPNILLERLLRKAGAPADFFESYARAEFLSAFRKDTDFYAELFRCDDALRVKSPVLLLLAKRDLFTGNLRAAEKRWRFYCPNLQKMVLLDTDNHYFQTEYANVVGKLISQGYDEEEFAGQWAE